MNKRIYFIIILILIGFKLFAQTTSNNDVWKKLDYLYEHQEWQELINVSKLIKPEQDDMSKLNLYMAVSHYNLNKYRIANKYFIKAYKNDTSNFLKEIYYKSLVSNYDFMEARNLSENITDSLLRDEIGVRKETFVISASTYFGAVFYNDFDNQLNPGNKDTIFNNLYPNKQNIYYSANIRLMLNTFYNLDISFNQFINNKTQIVILDTLNQEFNRDNKHNNTNFRIKYNSTKIDWDVGFNFDSYNEEFTYFLEKDTSFTPATKYMTRLEMYFFANADYNFDYSSIGLNFAYGNLFNKNQIQLGFNFNFYPFANDNLVLSISPTYIKAKDAEELNYKMYSNTYSGNYYDNGLITNFGIAFRFSDKFKLSASVDFGGVNIVNSNPNYYIYNDDIKSLYQLSTEYSFNKHLSAFLTYSYNKFNHYYINNERSYNSEENSKQDILTGIMYKF